MRSLSAAGRVTVSGSARDMQSLQEKHRAYLQSLQNKNQVVKSIREADDARRHEQIRREQGFNCCFSGANATARKGSARRNSICGGTPGVGVGNDFFGMRNGGGGYVGSKWEERTVEIRGEDGEVYAIRPCGERDDLRIFKNQDLIFRHQEENAEEREFDLQEHADDAYALWAAAAATQIKSPCFKSPKSTCEAKVAKEKALALLRAQRQTPHSVIMGESDPFGLNCAGEENDRDDEAIGDLTQIEVPPVIGSSPEEVESQITAKVAEDIGDLTQIEVPPVIGSSPEEVESQITAKVAEDIRGEEMQENDLLTCTHSQTVTECSTTPEKLLEPTALAERIAKLPSEWRVSLLQRLEEAEADVSLSHSRRQGADSRCKPTEHSQLEPISPNIGKISTSVVDLVDCAPMPVSSRLA